MTMSGMFIFSCIIFGNLIDNHNKPNHHRRMILIASIAFGLLCITKGGVMILLRGKNDHDSRELLVQCLRSIHYAE